MYQNIKSCVKSDGKTSGDFFCQSGVRQGEDWSPLLFVIYLNNLESFLINEQCNGVNIYDNHLITLLKIHILLYADDTVIFAENNTDIQNSLNVFHNYCVRSNYC